MKIVVLDGYTLNPGDLTWEGLEALGEVAVYDRTEPEQLMERVSDAEIILTNKTLLNRESLEQFPKVRYIGVLATGYNVVDVEAAQALGMVVTNIPTYGTDAVAQFAFALLLELCHHVGEHSQSVKKGDWSKAPDFCYWNHPLIELAGKTMGIIGMGRIGRRTAQIAQAFGMNILAHSRHKDPSLESESLRFVELDTLMKGSDVISLHCPLFEATKGMINKASISEMKKGVLLINTSRGPLIVDEDLAEALLSGHVAGAAMDVLSEEPASPENPLLNAPNCIITPHIAWAPKEARIRLMHIAVENVRCFLNGEPQNKVN